MRAPGFFDTPQLITPHHPMTKKTTWRPPAAPRTTVPLGRTVATTEASLDHSAHLGIAYAQAWLARHGSKKVPSSGVLRRAVACYLLHLSDPATDPRSEVNEVARACDGHIADAEAQQEAWERLQQAPKDAPLPPWLEVSIGPQRLAELDALEARSDALYRQVMAERAQRLNDGRARARAARQQQADGSSDAAPPSSITSH